MKARREMPQTVADDENGPDTELPNPTALMEQLQQCQKQYRTSRRELYQYFGTVYVIALRMSVDHEAKSAFYSEPYWSHRPRWKIRTRRDFFRDIWKFLIEADTKLDYQLASKYAAVLWHLDTGKVPPEDAVSMIEISGGIEKVARSGVSKPIYLDPRDVGDGMTATGERIQYEGETDGDGAECDRLFHEVEILNDEVLKQFARTAEGRCEVQIRATFDSVQYSRPCLEIHSVAVLPWRGADDEAAEEWAWDG